MTQTDDMPVLALNWNQRHKQVSLHLDLQQAKVMLEEVAYIYAPALAARVQVTCQHKFMPWLERTERKFIELDKPEDTQPHDLFCECRTCNPSFRKYHRFLKNELKWTKQGHVR